MLVLLLHNPGLHSRRLGYIVFSDPMALGFMLSVQLYKQLFVISLPRLLTRPEPKDGKAFFLKMKAFGPEADAGFVETFYSDSTARGGSGPQREPAPPWQRP